jgi:LytS/YehU family sensor histidine kinase
VRHGIDPSEDGGRIDVSVRAQDGRCRIRVEDSGVGLRATGDSLGTGLATLRERLQLAYGREAELRLTARETGGVRAEVEFPMPRRSA